jgi:hypothetical protein
MNDEVFYSSNKIHKPIKVMPLNNYILHIEYEDGKIIDFDVKNLLSHPLFKPLKEKTLFETVRINGSSICWDNDIDICADSIYKA